MTTTRDPLAVWTEEGPDRLAYQLGVMLDAQDFEDEQTYHRKRLARALQYLFGTGTAVGLRVRDRPLAPGEVFARDTAELQVLPGLAIDVLGRLIEVPRTWCLRLQRWLDSHGLDRADFRAAAGDDGTIVADVFLRFIVCPRRLTPAFASGPFDATDAFAHERLRDGFELKLEPRRVDPPAAGPVSPLARVLAADDGAPELNALHEEILDGWRDGTESWDEDGPNRFDEIPATLDPTSLLLARVTIPVRWAAADATPQLTAAPAAPDNNVRRFVYGFGVLTRPPR
jgi:hypothetical protein